MPLNNPQPPSGQDSIDLRKLVEQADVSIKSPETPADGAHRRRKDMIQFCVALVVVVGVLMLCFYLAFFDGTRSADEKRWTQSVVFAIISGFIGFLAGKKI